MTSTYGELPTNLFPTYLLVYHFRTSFHNTRTSIDTHHYYPKNDTTSIDASTRSIFSIWNLMRLAPGHSGALFPSELGRYDTWSQRRS